MSGLLTSPPLLLLRLLLLPPLHHWIVASEMCWTTCLGRCAECIIQTYEGQIQAVACFAGQFAFLLRLSHPPLIDHWLPEQTLDLTAAPCYLTWNEGARCSLDLQRLKPRDQLTWHSGTEMECPLMLMWTFHLERWLICAVLWLWIGNRLAQ